MTLLLRLIDGARRPRRPIEIPATQLFVRESTTGSVEEGDDLAKAVEMIRRQACSSLTVNELVKSLSVSRRWLELEFRKHMGRSPNEEIQRVRLFHAEQLLQLADMPITRVAELVGFAESSGLTHFFQKHTSYSPTAYRQWAHRLRKS
jgi:LacI family transcriptional regulator